MMTATAPLLAILFALLQSVDLSSCFCREACAHDRGRGGPAEAPARDCCPPDEPEPPAPDCVHAAPDGDLRAGDAGEPPASGPSTTLPATVPPRPPAPGLVAPPPSRARGRPLHLLFRVLRP